jgi:ADP-dependent NAD(P)H-hydrate dehydratase / NAD(P)H-hydrate epimerase
MTKILSTNQIRMADEYTIQHEPISSLDLMERASKRILEWMLRFIPVNR